MAKDLLQELNKLGNNLIRYGVVIYDTESTEEDLVIANRSHNIRKRTIIYEDNRYLVHMRDGLIYKVEFDYDHPTMMKESPKYRKDIEDRVERSKKGQLR